MTQSYVVLAQCVDGDPDRAEWRIYDSRTAKADAFARCTIFRQQGFRHVHVRPVGAIVEP